MQTPFIYGKTVTGKQFINREKEKNRLINNFQNGINTILISPRRYGKTSLVKEVISEFYDENIKFVFFDLFRLRDEESFYSVYVKEIIKSTASKNEDLIKTGKEFFSKLIPKLTFSFDPMVDLSVGFDWQEVKKTPDEIINLPEMIALKKNIRIVVCIDEFQNIANFPNYQFFERLLRSYWQNHSAVSYCLLGSKRHMMIEIFNKKSRPFYRFGDMLMLDRIDESHWVEYIIKAFNESGKTISTDQSQKIAKLMKNHPYYVQQLCYQVWLSTSNEVTEMIIENAITEILEINTIFYQQEIENLSSTQINLLKAIAFGETKLTSVDVMSKYKVGTPNNILKNKKILAEKDIIDFQRNEPAFIDPAFDLWFLRFYLKN